MMDLKHKRRNSITSDLMNFHIVPGFMNEDEDDEDISALTPSIRKDSE